MEMMGKIRRMYFRDKLSLHQIAKRTGLSRNTIRKWIRAPETQQPVYQLQAAYNKLSPFHAMVATDAACEGLNLQTLGTLINVDLPWNPTKLEQRIGRIKRFGQVRDRVDMLNLVNEQTVDEKVYGRLSERMKDRFDIFGSLPDTIKDEWIDDIEHLGELMDQYINAQKKETGFDLCYNATLRPTDNDWRDCANVLSPHDFDTLMRKGW
jgi:transcriptional regulator with XRE-family HTH domain